MGSLGAIANIAASRRYPSLDRLYRAYATLFGKNDNANQKRAAFADWATARTEERMAMKSSRPDFMSHIMDKGSLSPEEMQTNNRILLQAGSETTATALCGITYYLTSTPRAMAGLTRELHATFADADAVTLDDLAELEYLNAVIHEGLRLFPPVPGGFLRRLPRDEGDTIGGNFVPPNVRHVRPHLTVIPQR